MYGLQNFSFWGNWGLEHRAVMYLRPVSTEIRSDDPLCLVYIS